MDKSAKATFIVCVTVIASVAIVTYGVICFGQSLERSCDKIKDGMRGQKTMHIPSTINLKVSSSSIESVGHNIEKASKNISTGMMNSPRVTIPSNIGLSLSTGRSADLKVHLHKTGN